MTMVNKREFYSIIAVQNAMFVFIVLMLIETKSIGGWILVAVASVGIIYCVHEIVKESVSNHGDPQRRASI